MGLFLSTITNRMDKKGRVSVPASFRSALSTKDFNGVICYPSPGVNSITGCSYERIKQISDAIDAQGGPFDQLRDDFSTAILSDSHQLSFDSEGRIHIPDELLKHSLIKDYATFVGQGSTFQIWDPNKFEKYKSKARATASQQRNKLKWGNINQT